MEGRMIRPLFILIAITAVVFPDVVLKMMEGMLIFAVFLATSVLVTALIEVIGFNREDGSG
jgi:hypothetical protein